MSRRANLCWRDPSAYRGAVGRIALVSSFAILAGCAADALPIEAAGSTGTSTGGSPIAIAESSSTHAADASSGPVGTGTDDSGTSEGPRFDVPGPDAPPQIVTCAGAGAEVDVVMTTPSGPFAPTHAWWAWDFCCVTDPLLVLAEAPELEIRDGVLTTPHVRVYVPGTWERTEPYLGPREVVVKDVGAGGVGGPLTGFELVEPLDPDVSPETATPDLVGTFAIDGEGWTINGSVTAPYCAAIEVPGCPCE